MGDRGYKRMIITRLGNMPNGSVVSIDDMQSMLPAEAGKQAGSQAAADLARGDNPMLARISPGVYRVVNGRRSVGRPPAPKVEPGAAAKTLPTSPYSETVRNMAKETVAMVVPAAPADNDGVHPPLVMMALVRGLPDGSGLYADDLTGSIYKVVKVA